MREGQQPVVYGPPQKRPFGHPLLKPLCVLTLGHNQELVEELHVSGEHSTMQIYCRTCGKHIRMAKEGIDYER